jgi:hypothetical protein
MYLGENWPLAAEESRSIDSEAAFGTIFRTIVTVFKEASRDLLVIFLFHKAGHLRMCGNTDLI